MPIEFDHDTITCSTTFNGEILQDSIPDVVITTNDGTHMSEALLAGKHVPITEAEADALTVNGAQDHRHHTVARGGAI
jgi:hypothetical protein